LQIPYCTLSGCATWLTLKFFDAGAWLKKTIICESKLWWLSFGWYNHFKPWRKWLIDTFIRSHIFTHSDMIIDFNYKHLYIKIVDRIRECLLNDELISTPTIKKVITLCDLSYFTWQLFRHLVNFFLLLCIISFDHE